MVSRQPEPKGRSGIGRISGRRRGAEDAGRAGWPRLTGRVAGLTALAAVAAVTVSGVAVAAIPDSGTQIFHGCYSTTTGALRLINRAKGQHCSSGENAVTWHQAGVIWLGDWGASVTYRAYNAVTYNGASYLAKTASTGKVPSANPAQWALIAKAGKPGATGGSGSPGGALMPSQLTLGVGVPAVLSGGSYGFSTPQQIAFDGTHLWITNSEQDSVTEVNASDGSWVQTLSGGSYGFSGPGPIAFDGAHLWIANNSGNSVTEINASDGSWVRTISNAGNSNYGFGTAAGIAFDGAHLWITNLGGGGGAGSVTEVNASDGSWVRTLSGGSYGFGGPYQMAFDGAHLWITNTEGNSVTEVNASDGSWMQTLSGNGYGFRAPNYITFDGAHLWITNTDSVTAISG